MACHWQRCKITFIFVCETKANHKLYLNKNHKKIDWFVNRVFEFSLFSPVCLFLIDPRKEFRWQTHNNRREPLFCRNAKNFSVWCRRLRRTCLSIIMTTRLSIVLRRHAKNPAAVVPMGALIGEIGGTDGKLLVACSAQ